MSLLLLFVSLFSSIWIARLITKDAVLLAPAVTMLSWALLLGTCVGNAITVSALWWPLWIMTFTSALTSAWVYRQQWRSLRAIILPALCALVVLAPWVYHGIRFYPGSWFWDGFAYLAIAETLWRYPITAPADGLEPVYLLGQSNFAFRFIGSSLISVFRGLLPIGAGSDGSVGFFLIACLTTYACSCAYLGRRYLAPGLQMPFTVLATVSGPVINLVWANNFDHILALSIAPALLGFCLELDFKKAFHAAFVGSASAILTFVYPEMAAFLLLPVALVLITRAIREKPHFATPMLIVVAAFAITLSPLAVFIHKFMIYQLGTVGRPAALRPGNGYFPTLLDFKCFYGAVSGLYAPFQPCTATAIDITKFHLGLAVAFATTVGLYIRRDAVSASAAILFSAMMFFLIRQQYDYAAFKILSSGAHLFTLLAVSALAVDRASVRLVGAFAAALLLLFALVKVHRLNEIVRYKSLVPFSEVANKAPIDAIVAIKVADPLRFEWVTFYLRNSKTVPIEGQFAYLKPDAFDRAPYLERKNNYTHVVTDTEFSDGRIVWGNSLFRLYRRKAD